MPIWQRSTASRLEQVRRNRWSLSSGLHIRADRRGVRQLEVAICDIKKEKQVAKAVLDAMIVKNQVAGALDRVKQPAAKAKRRAKRGTHAKE